MGNPKQKWTAEEEEALCAGIAKYGPGKWKFIQRDPEFNKYLNSRSNIDLKDKWRNMSAATQGSREKCRTPKVKAFQNPSGVPASDMLTSSSDLPVVHEFPAEHVKEEASKDLVDVKNGPRYNDMIFEALSTTKEAHGLDITQLIAFIEQRAEVPPNFRKLLGSRLRRLVATEKLIKYATCSDPFGFLKYDVCPSLLKQQYDLFPCINEISGECGYYHKELDNCFLIKSNSATEKKPHTVKDIQPKQLPIPDQKAVFQSLETAAKNAASLVAEAENKSSVADIYVKEAERIARMAEDTEAMLLFAQEIFEKCNRGEVVFLA